MKKILLSIIIILVVGSISFGEVGDNDGNVYYSDIVTKINGMPVKSYNIDYNTYICVDDLNKIGFDIIWHGDNRIIEVKKNENKKSVVLKFNEVKPYKKEYNIDLLGTVKGKAIKSDIKLMYNGKIIQSKNVDGFTLMGVKTLCNFDIESEFNQEKREITINSMDTKQAIEYTNDISDNVVIRRYLKKDLEENLKYYYYSEFFDEGKIRHYIYLKDYIDSKIQYVVILNSKRINEEDYFEEKLESAKEVVNDTFIVNSDIIKDGYLYVFLDNNKEPVGYSIKEGLSKKDGSFGVVEIRIEVENEDIDLSLGKNFDLYIKGKNTKKYNGKDLESKTTCINNNIEKERVYISKDYEALYLKGRDYSIKTEILDDDEIIRVKSKKIIKIK